MAKNVELCVFCIFLDFSGDRYSPQNESKVKKYEDYELDSISSAL